MRLDPISLRLFVCVVEEGTIAAAAERSHIAPAAVSKRISELESLLGTQLLQRSNKGVTPTAAGVALRRLARRVLHELDDVYAQMQDYTGGVRGQVHLFANISSIAAFLPAELKAFMAERPQVSVHLEERVSTQVARAVSENAADVGIVSMVLPEWGLETFAYHSDRLVLITPRDHPLAERDEVDIRDALSFHFVGLHADSSINLELGRAAAECSMPLRLRILVTGYDALCLMVEAGLGVGVMPEQIARRYAKTIGVRVVRLDAPWAHRELQICVRAYDKLPVAAQMLVDHLRRKR